MPPRAMSALGHRDKRILRSRRKTELLSREKEGMKTESETNANDQYKNVRNRAPDGLGESRRSYKHSPFRSFCIRFLWFFGLNSVCFGASFLLGSLP